MISWHVVFVSPCTACDFLCSGQTSLFACILQGLSVAQWSNPGVVMFAQVQLSWVPASTCSVRCACKAHTLGMHRPQSIGLSVLKLRLFQFTVGVTVLETDAIPQYHLT